MPPVRGVRTAPPLPLPPLPLLLLLLCVVPGTVSGTQTITIGGFFYNANNTESLREVAFRQAIEKVNAEAEASRRSIAFAYQVERLSTTNSLPASRRVCDALRRVGMAAIFGPDLEPASGHVQSICDAKAIPHVQTHMRDTSVQKHFSINLHPHPGALSKAYADILEMNHWPVFAVLYEDNESLLRLQQVLKLPQFDNQFQMSVRQLPADGHYRHVLKSVMDSKVRHVVLDCSAGHVHTVLKQAQQIGMITSEYSFFITSLDLHTVDLKDFSYSGANITGLRLIDPSDPKIIMTVREWRERQREQGVTRQLPSASSAASPLTIHARSLKTSDALLYDAVHVLAAAVRDLSTPLDLSVTPLDCAGEFMWAHGDSLINYMRMVKQDGLTGRIEFDAEGRRTFFSLDVVELKESGLVRLGSWSPRGSNMTQRARPAVQDQNRTVVITTILKDPYTMLKESSILRKGNDRFEGICVDIIDELSKELNFNYSFHLNPDDTPGRPNAKTGKWNGMIGELLEGNAHMAITDLTITKSRQEVVDFTMQWLSLGIGLLYTKPVRQPPNLFSFLSPLSLEVWIYIALAYLGVSVLMFLLARFTPYEWDHPHPCHLNQDVLENQFNFLNALWFCIGSLVQQGCDFLPKAVSTRMVAGSWWFFTLIMVSSYTANLAAFLTVETLVSPISSAEDLARQTEIKYGVQESGATAQFFRGSRISPFDKMWSFMESQEPSVFEKTRDGINRVSTAAGKYAYFMESSTIEYTIERRCDLTQVGGLLDNKGYGIAVSKWSPVSASELSEIILKMQEDGRLQRLKTLWWKNKKEGGKCLEQNAKKGSVSALTLKNVGGVFVCLMCGVALAVVQSCLEFIWAVRNQAAEENVPFASEAMKELSFVFRFRGNTKPVRRPVTVDEDEATIPFSTNSSGQYAASGYGYTSRS
ncbi:LOW QUALITY PROTEIN: glutamate receptor ionotropic, kainate 2-like [Pollicipes pollicipes]|uniref:LOW QUALITY PROTEIN: glutamate receptor ionotropic, kainate 2-like n=1 Tax=Pollicipes pollicipes TaxID=41117 RepID=UPI0018853782|nr:LOW QUALITY PROTEIN: glutamate receptor ionotropic, kainate 2-like [Pollicipes pollicipes]